MLRRCRAKGAKTLQPRATPWEIADHPIHQPCKGGTFSFTPLIYGEILNDTLHGLGSFASNVRRVLPLQGRDSFVMRVPRALPWASG